MCKCQNPNSVRPVFAFPSHISLHLLLSFFRISFAVSVAQQPSVSEEAKTYCRRYNASSFPHMALIDPRTGMKVWDFQGFLGPSDFIEKSEHFFFHFLEGRNAAGKKVLCSSKASVFNKTCEFSCIYGKMFRRRRYA